MASTMGTDSRYLSDESKHFTSGNASIDWQLVKILLGAAHKSLSNQELTKLAKAIITRFSNLIAKISAIVFDKCF